MRLAGLALALAACGSSPPSTPPAATATTPPPTAGAAPVASAPTAITGADDAIARFIAAWAAEVRPRIPGHPDPLIGSIDESMRGADARPRYSAQLGPCRAASQPMVDLMAQAHYDFVLFGSMDAARAHASCWAVNYICCMKGDAGALLDPATGALLVVWRIPEG